MDYQTCLEQFISIRRADCGDEAGAELEADIAIYRSFPIPSAAEWAEVLKMVASDGGPTGPYSCMCLYEVLLKRRGFQTTMTPEWEKGFDEFMQIVLNAGVPREQAYDVLRHYQMLVAQAKGH